jgi:hypothetical protein
MNDMSETNIVAIPTANALEIFTSDHAIDPILARVRAEIDAFKADISTVTGRKAVASIAYRVARSKTYLDDAGKALADEQKAIPKKIDACRKRIRDTLDAWRDEVRKPLTDWEKAEDDRVAYHKSMLQHIEDCGNGFIGGDLQPFGILFRELEEKIIINSSFEEYEGEAHKLKAAALVKLRAAADASAKRAAEQEELDKLRAAAAERAKKDHEAQITRDAEARAVAKAEADARAERDRVEATARAERQAAEHRELQLKLAAEQAERRALEAEQTAKREAERKVKLEAEALAAREADIKHRGRINGEALAAFVTAGIAEDIAKQVITLIAKGTIAHVRISY